MSEVKSCSIDMRDRKLWDSRAIESALKSQEKLNKEMYPAPFKPKINHDLKMEAIKFNHRELRGILENHDMFDKEYIQVIAKLMVKKIREIKKMIRRHKIMEKAGMPVSSFDYGNM